MMFLSICNRTNRCDEVLRTILNAPEVPTQRKGWKHWSTA